MAKNKPTYLVTAVKYKTESSFVFSWIFVFYHINYSEAYGSDGKSDVESVTSCRTYQNVSDLK